MKSLATTATLALFAASQTESVQAATIQSQVDLAKKHHHKKARKAHKGVSFVQTQQNKEVKHAAPPSAKTLVNTKAKNEDNFDKYSQAFDVPIDEAKAITMKISPTYALDHVESVTLKSFRKVVGYDTFNSILKKDRDEKKDIADYYNVTVSMMVKRVPETTAAPPLKDPYDGSKTLTQTLDKGFPYDDGDSSIDDMTPNWKNGKAAAKATNVGKLNGENVTKEALVALVKDTDSPVTQGLVQLEAMKSDSDGMFAFGGENVTRGNLKNLVTDKPSPITVALAQKSDSDGMFAFGGENVTRGNLKNLVTDKPSPITVALAQKSDKDGMFAFGGENVTRGNLKNLVTDKPSPITVALAQKSDKDGMFAFGGENVTRGNLKNLVTDKPSPITVALAQKSDKDGMFAFGGENVTRGNLKNLVTDKPSPITVALAQKSDSDGMFAFGGENVTRGNLKNLVTDKPSPITVALAQKSDKDGMFAFGGENVTRGNLKNLVTDKPSPITVALAQKSDSDGMFAFGGENVTRGNLKNLVTDKPSPITVSLAQVNMPEEISLTQVLAGFAGYNDIDLVQVMETEKWDNRWLDKFGQKNFGAIVQKNGPSENLETPATIHGLNGNETLGEHINVGGDAIRYHNKMMVDGQEIKFNYEDEEAKEVKLTQKHNWMTDNDEGDDDEEIRKLRKELKNGVLTYQSYMERKKIF